MKGLDNPKTPDTRSPQWAHPAACSQRSCLPGVIVESDASLHDGQSDNVEAAATQAFGWVIDDAVRPPTPPPQATHARSGFTNPSAGSKQLLEGLPVALLLARSRGQGRERRSRAARSRREDPRRRSRG
jgi:hypothetical protein